MKLILFLTAAMTPVWAQQNCTYAVNPVSFLIGPEATREAKFTVSAPEGCPWSPAIPSTVKWLHITVISATSGDGFVAWYADRNDTATARSVNIAIGTVSVNVTQGPAVCSYTLTPPAANFPPEGGSGSVGIRATCQWVAGTASNWITIGTPNSGLSDGNLPYSVGPNACINPRTGVVAVALPNSGNQPQYQTSMTVTQAGLPTGLAAVPASLSFGTAAAEGRLSVITPPGCTWGASTNVSWLQLVAPVSGNGSGTLGYRVLANNGPARAGTIVIGPVTVAVTQAGTAATAVEITSVTNGASYAPDAISPGEIVAIFGNNLGPAVPVTLQLTPDGSAITRSLAGVQVLFDGTAAPLIFVSKGQINAIVPYGVAGKPSVDVQVQAPGGPSPVFSKIVQATTPGIFTQDRSGLGPGAILNQDYGLNGSAARAVPGDIVMIYCTGAGVTAPASADGSVTGVPPPELTLPVSVTIGGVDAPVVFRGAAPGSVAGLTQINARVPDGVSGIVPVFVTIGAVPSKSGVTVAVR